MQFSLCAATILLLFGQHGIIYISKQSLPNICVFTKWENITRRQKLNIQAKQSKKKRIHSENAVNVLFKYIREINFFVFSFRSTHITVCADVQIN